MEEVYGGADQLALVPPTQESDLFADEPLDEPSDSTVISREREEAEARSRAESSEWLRRQSTAAVDAEKPPFRVPTMVEVNATPPNGLSIVSTFSGAGGSCLGFRMAGFRTLLASEFVPAAAETYRANFPSVPIAVGDVRELEPELILARLGIERGDLDVLEGSPPCASFSTAGRREAGWGEVKKYSDVKQRTDDLFDEYVRLVAGLKPKVFVAENVAGFLYGAADHFRKWVDSMLRDLDYRVWFLGAPEGILDAASFGVPQRRRRVIIVGVRRDVGLAPSDFEPRLLPYRYSFADALASLEPPTIEELDETSIERFAIGEEWRKLGPGEQSERYFSLVLPKLDEPLPTLTQTAGSLGAASVVHPMEQRKLTDREARRLSSFPDDFVLTGSYEQRIERIGRAVPPLMMRAVAERIRDALLSSASPGMAVPSDVVQPLPQADDDIPEPSVDSAGGDAEILSLFADEPE